MKETGRQPSIASDADIDAACAGTNVEAGSEPDAGGSAAAIAALFATLSLVSSTSNEVSDAEIARLVRQLNEVRTDTEKLVLASEFRQWLNLEDAPAVV